jgi:cytochrome c1
LSHAPIPAALLLMLTVVACKAPPKATQAVAGADPSRGRTAIERAGCGACHTIPGIWPQGKTAMAIDSTADQGLIAGRLPNRPDLLAAFLRNAPATLPGSTMPPMPLGEREARDAVAYLYSLEDR